MSRILRRPMFRGGPVDSRGTGITSGLMDEPKRGLVDGPGGYAGKLILGRDLNPLLNLNNMDSYIPVGQVEETETETDDRGFLQKFYDTLNPSKETVEERLKKQDEGMTTFDEKMENIGVVTNKRKQEIADEAIAKATATVGGKSEAPGGGDPGMFLTPKEKDLSTSNEPSSTVIDEKALIREQAELFKELLGEQNEKKLKDARISDASDYLLKFFEGSQKEGATVGSAAADVAGFATARDSKTEKAIAANEKVDQTATVLAINDYISGKRSKEDIMKALSVAKARISLSEGTLGDKILKAKGSGPVTVTVIRDVLRSEPEFSGKSVEEFDSTKADLTYSEGDENKIFIDVITKETFTFDENKNKKRIY